MFGIALANVLSAQDYAHAGHNDLIQLRVNDQQLGASLV